MNTLYEQLAKAQHNARYAETSVERQMAKETIKQLEQKLENE